MEPAKVVARFADGAVLKGTTHNFTPTRDFFHLHPIEGTAAKATVVRIKELKALFFVKDFVGNAQLQAKKSFNETDKIQGRKLEVTFADGEVLLGYTQGYDRERMGFFLIPAESPSNNIRVFAVNAAIKTVRYL